MNIFGLEIRKKGSAETQKTAEQIRLQNFCVEMLICLDSLVRSIEDNCSFGKSDRWLRYILTAKRLIVISRGLSSKPGFFGPDYPKLSHTFKVNSLDRYEIQRLSSVDVDKYNDRLAAIASDWDISDALVLASTLIEAALEI